MDYKYLTKEERQNLTKLLNFHNIEDLNSFLYEVGLVINFEMGVCYIANNQKWVFGKIKYGI